jgi:hemerythrin-like domain-containing protein
MLSNDEVTIAAEPIHSLKHDHRVIERALRALDGISMRIQWGERVPLSALSQVVDFISNFADCYHHGKEEAHLFPALKRQGVEHEGGPLGVMERQHEIERELTDKMVTALDGYRDLDPEAAREFSLAARKYTDHLTAHIQTEDSLLFRIADELLDDLDKQEVGEAFARVRMEFGVASLEKYELLATQLEDAWGV